MVKGWDSTRVGGFYSDRDRVKGSDRRRGRVEAE